MPCPCPSRSTTRVCCLHAHSRRSGVPPPLRDAKTVQSRPRSAKTRRQGFPTRLWTRRPQMSFRKCCLFCKCPLRFAFAQCAFKSLFWIVITCCLRFWPALTAAGVHQEGIAECSAVHCPAVGFSWMYVLLFADCISHEKS